MTSIKPKDSVATTPDREASEAWHSLEAMDAVSRLRGEAEHGLSETEARRRLSEHGSNELTAAEGRSVWKIVLDQFQSLIVLLLAIAAIVAFALGETIEAVAI